jgi:hypothetical protein
MTSGTRSASAAAILALGLATLPGCPSSIADLSWTGLGSPGEMQSAEWIRYRTTSDITFTGELTLSFFILTNVPDFCGAYQTAIADSFDAFGDYTAAREPYADADDLRNPQLCELTVDYFQALADATASLTPEGAFYLNTSFGFGGGGGIVLEEGQPQEGTLEMSATPLLEDGDFFRTYVRFYEANPYQLMVERLNCGDPDWGNVFEQLGYTEYVGERRASGEGGTLQSELLDDDLAHLAHSDVLTVDRARTSAGVVDSNAEYLKCDISTHEFFLRIFER